MLLIMGAKSNSLITKQRWMPSNELHFLNIDTTILSICHFVYCFYVILCRLLLSNTLPYGTRMENICAQPEKPFAKNMLPAVSVCVCICVRACMSCIPYLNWKIYLMPLVERTNTSILYITFFSSLSLNLLILIENTHTHTG